MADETSETAIDVVNRMYLPEFVTLENDGDYSGDSAIFTFNPREPVVAAHPVEYITPRGLHICISQALYCFYEKLANEGELPFSLEEARDIYFDMRLRIAELNQRFRRELEVESFQGRFYLGRFRVGKDHSLAQFSFDFGDRAITGDLTAMISPNPVSPTNAYAARVS